MHHTSVRRSYFGKRISEIERPINRGCDGKCGKRGRNLNGKSCVRRASHFSIAPFSIFPIFPVLPKQYGSSSSILQRKKRFRISPDRSPSGASILARACTRIARRKCLHARFAVGAAPGGVADFNYESSATVAHSKFGSRFGGSALPGNETSAAHRKLPRAAQQPRRLRLSSSSTSKFFSLPPLVPPPPPPPPPPLPRAGRNRISDTYTYSPALRGYRNPVCNYWFWPRRGPLAMRDGPALLF